MEHFIGADSGITWSVFPSIGYVIGKDLFQFCRLPLSELWCPLPYRNISVNEVSLVVDFCACAIGVLCRKTSSVSNEFKIILYFPFYQIQDVWSYVKVLGLLGDEFCAGQ